MNPLYLVPGYVSSFCPIKSNIIWGTQNSDSLYILKTNLLGGIFPTIRTSDKTCVHHNASDAGRQIHIHTHSHSLTGTKHTHTLSGTAHISASMDRTLACTVMHIHIVILPLSFIHMYSRAHRGRCTHTCMNDILVSTRICSHSHSSTCNAYSHAHNTP